MLPRKCFPCHLVQAKNPDYTLTFNLRLLNIRPMSRSGEQESYQSDLKASDVLTLAGLTYRQLHDWERRAGIIDSERASAEGWRKFTFEEVVALAICVRLRDHFSLPLERTGRIYAWLSGKHLDEVDEIIAAEAERTLEIMQRDPKVAAIRKGDFRDFPKGKSDEAVRSLVRRYVNASINKASQRPASLALKMAQSGLPVYLVTNLEEFMMLSEYNLVQWVSERLVSKPTIIFPVNDVLNKILAVKGIPQHTLDRLFTSFRTYWDKLEQRAELKPSEQEVLRLIRERGYQRITAHIKEGQIIRVERDEDLTVREQIKLEQEILEAIRNGDHQTVTVEKRDGKIVRIGRKASIKLDKVTGKP